MAQCLARSQTFPHHPCVHHTMLGQCTQVLVDKMRQDTTWVTVSGLLDPILLFKLIEKFVLKQSNNQYKMAVLIAKQLSILFFCQDNQVPNTTYYNQFTTRVEVACQAGVCYYTPDLLDTKCVGCHALSMKPRCQPSKRMSETLLNRNT